MWNCLQKVCGKSNDSLWSVTCIHYIEWLKKSICTSIVESPDPVFFHSIAFSSFLEFIRTFLVNSMWFHVWILHDINSFEPNGRASLTQKKLNRLSRQRPNHTKKSPVFVQPLKLTMSKKYDQILIKRFNSCDKPIIYGNFTEMYTNSIDSIAPVNWRLTNGKWIHRFRMISLL